MLIEFFSNKVDTFYYVDDSDFSVWRSGKRGKLLPVKHQKGRYGVCVNAQCFYDASVGRLRTRKLYLSYIVGRYVLKAERKYVIEYADGDIYNFSKDNVSLRYLSDLCSEWKKMDVDGYYVSSKGDVYSEGKACLLFAFKDRGGYYSVSIEGINIKRSHLVWKYFGGGAIPDGYVIDHIDNIPSNDSIDNLQCITTRNNIIKEYKRSLPTGVHCEGSRYTAYISYSLNGVFYENRYLGSYDSATDAGAAYQKALKIVEGGEDPLKNCSDSNIRYSFKDDSWFFICPQSKGCDKKYNGFKTYDEALVKYKEVNRIDTENESEIERIIRKGLFSFKWNNCSYQINKRRYGDVEFIKAYEFLKECRENDCVEKFVDSIDELRKRIHDEDKRINDSFKTEKIAKANKKEEKRLIQAQKRLKEKEERKERERERKYNFAFSENYKKNKGNDACTFNIPHIDGKRYYLHSFMDENIIEELDEIMNEHKFSDDFPEWLYRFKIEELPKYIERDKASRSDSFKKQMGYKGYDWFKPRKCWRIRRIINGHTYVIGYFHNEECCKWMAAEVDKAISEGRFEEWYKNIDFHKLYARKIFDDGSLQSNAVKSTISKLGLS